MELIVTKHAQQRMKERVGIKNIDRMQRLMETAYEKGFSLENTDCGMILKALERADKAKYPCRTLRMYNDQIFVFRNNLLLTVLPLDSLLRKRMEMKRCKLNKKQAA